MRFNRIGPRLTVAVSLLISSAFAQTNSPAPQSTPDATKDCIPYHRLTVDDFPINDREHPKDGIWVQTCLWYDFKPLMTSDVHYYARVTEWIVHSGFDRAHSSRRSAFHQMADALPGAQAYLDITELHARQLAALPPVDLPVGTGETPNDAMLNLQLKLRQLYEKVMIDIRDECEKFQKETNRGVNKAKVREWQSRLRQRLKEAGITPSPG